MSDPQVSICTPTYNGARYLGLAIESALSQGFGDFELVICDDGSTDETPDLVLGYRDRRVRYRRFGERAGQAGNFNRCLVEARGRYFTMLHDDDFLLPGFLHERVTEFRRFDDAGFVLGAVRHIDSQGRTLGIQAPWPEDRSFAAGELVEPLLRGSIFNLASLMIRTEVVRRVGKFRQDLTWGHDWEWALRLAGASPARYTHVPLVAYRVHAASGTAAILRESTHGEQERRILRDALGRTGARGARARQMRRAAFHALARRHMYFAEQALLAGRGTAVRYNLRYALLADPTLIGRPTWWALGVGSLGPQDWYHGYRRLRRLVRRAAP
jgi:glycosyltransferase involved in cell wall biosynthesis